MKTYYTEEKIQKRVQLLLVGSPKGDKLQEQENSLDCQRTIPMLSDLL